ncbi:hypothetical protein BRC83_07055 [Halobacteriales archaeon QS_1_68_17]|nr:MAG: hypothetical protein BRC83_07055 [Halobacteriales archaeon QS_1_68_17]
MITLDIDGLTFELKEGAIKHVGASTAAAEAKLYDVDAVEVREFGDERVKLAFADDEGNEVEIALFPGQAQEVARGIELLEDDSRVFE